MRISDWSSDVCSSDLHRLEHGRRNPCPVDVAIGEQVERRPGLLEQRPEQDRSENEEDRREYAVAFVAGQLGDGGVKHIEDKHGPRAAQKPANQRTEERRVGKESVRTLSTRGARDHEKK